MNLSASLLLFFALIATAGPALGSGLIPGLLDCDPIRISPSDNASLDSASLAEPAGIRIDSPNLSLEYNTENLIRTRTNGRLTADVTTWARAESLFIPLRISHNPTTIAVSHAVSNASAYYENDHTDTELTLQTDSTAWAINHSIGLTRIGIAGSQYSSLIPGMSAYPENVFKVFNGSTPVKFQLDNKDTLIQIARTISGNSEVCVTAGIGSNSLDILLGQDNNRISIPTGADTTQYGIEITRQVSRKLNIDMGYSHGSGSGSNYIYRNDNPSGTLQYNPGFHQLSTLLRYQKSPTSVWEAGYVSSNWDLHLRGISLKGKNLGINIQPFSDRIDFNAVSGLSVNYLHLGSQRQVSDKWRLGWRYKFGRIASDINADYIGRAFFGLINVSGNYTNSLLKTRLHALELSAQYVNGRTTVELRLQQVVPDGGGGGSTSAVSAPKDRKETTGGTSLSFTSSYAF